MNGPGRSLNLAATTHVNGVELAVVVFFFVVVSAGGFLAARWRQADDPHSLEEWGLGGRSFGTVVTWFLLGGDLYTAYTFVAVPAAMFGTGAISGFFAVPYTILIYPLVFGFMPRLWSVAHKHNWVTPADFIRGRYGSRALATAVAITGILATMPYIALQLVGIQAILDTMGVGGSGNTFLADLPLFVAFAVLAAYTYSSGLRAPALIAFVKDTLIYLVIVVAIVYIGVKIGYGTMFTAAKIKLTTPGPTGKAPGVFVPSSSTYLAYSTLALGSALALFMYPHSMTASLSAKSRDTIRRNAAILPLYSLMLAFLALIGYAAVAKKTSVFGLDGLANAQLAVPHFFDQVFPSWFAGVAFAAIALGALVPAAIMSIAAANLFTRNIYREFIAPQATPAQEAKVSKLTSLVVKFGALLFVLLMDKQNAINLQLLGGVWILQTFLAIVAGLFTRWFHRWALFAGWAVGMVYGTVVAYQQTVPNTKIRLADGKPVTELHGLRHFGSSLAYFPFTGTKVYVAVTAFAINILIAVVLTVVLRALRVDPGTDVTSPEDYYSDSGDPGIGELTLDVAEEASSATRRARADRGQTGRGQAGHAQDGRADAAQPKAAKTRAARTQTGRAQDGGGQGGGRAQDGGGRTGRGRTDPGQGGGRAQGGGGRTGRGRTDPGQGGGATRSS